MNFGWVSRLVHYILSFQLSIKKKYELWILVGPQLVKVSLIEFKHLTGLNCDYIKDLESPECEVTTEMVSFWKLMGVDVDDGPTSEQIITTCERCKEWSMDDCMWLGYLVIFTRFVEGRKYSPSIRASLARLVIVAFKVLMDSLRRKHLTKSYIVDEFIQVIQVWTRVNNFVLKDFGEMIPQWNLDVEDKAAENIIKVMFHKVDDTNMWVNPKTQFVYVKKEESPAKTETVVKEDSGRPWKKTRKEAPAEVCKEALTKACKEAPAEACKEAPTKARSKSSTAVESTSSDVQQGKVRRQTKDVAMVFVQENSDQAKKLVASQQFSFQKNSTANVIIPNTKVCPGYDPFAPIDKKMAKMLIDYNKTPSHKKKTIFLSKFVLRTDHNDLGKRLHGGMCDFYACMVLKYCQSKKIWGLNVDDIYAPVNYKNNHWIDIWMLEPFVTMILYFLIKCACSNEERVKYTLEPFTYERVTAGVHQC
ncbi:hypothetical protein N665_0383s0161 [Sinapis alba]|nr:hypothetical protein N665_0383s0161 [Sinapis alba]